MSSITVPTEEGQMTKPRYPVCGATQGPFSFGMSGFSIDHTFRESGKRLRRLLFSELLKTEKARKSARDDATVIDRPWIKAQLRHYGIDFSPDIDPFKAKALLLTSVAYGLCDAVPPQILKIKATLKGEYKSIMEDYYARMEAYRAQELPKRIKKFEACATPSEEVKCDASLFLRKYFLDEDGNPDRTKTTDLILLPGYTDKGLALTGRTERVPALHVEGGGLEGESNVTVIGWGRLRVGYKAHLIDLMQSSGRGTRRMTHDWDRQKMIHDNFVEIVGPKVVGSFDSYHTLGRYVMKCEAIQHDWPHISRQLHLRIIHRGRLAVFDLGIVIGLIVLGRTQEGVTKLLQGGNWDVDSTDAEYSGDESESEDTSSDEDSIDGGASGRDEALDYELGDGPDTHIDLTSDRPVKRQKVERYHPRRLYFQWRGYNTMTGAIQFDPQNRNTGYLDFADDNAMVFEGNILLDVMGGPISFQGYRLPGLAGPLTINWNALSHLPCERATVPKFKW